MTRTTSEALDLEFSIAPILARQQSYGVLFNVEKAKELECTLLTEKAKLRQQLQEVFKPRYINKGEFTPKVSRIKDGIKAGCTYTKIELQEYNPNSRPQTIDRLCKELGWSPTEFSDKGNPEFDEDIIESLPFKEMKPLKDFYTINKRLSQLSEGTQAWLKKVKSDGRIYGSIMQSGTITGRMSHFSPNMSQVPSNDKPYGSECRSLFTVSADKVMMGCDADALEMRICAGYLKTVDGGAFINTVLKGNKEEGTDMHTLNMYAYGLEGLENGRDCAKTAFYASLYGCKDPKLGLILQQYGVVLEDYVPDFEKQFKGLKKWAEEKKTGFTDAFLKCLLGGKEARKKYGEQQPTLPKLIKDIQETWKKNGYLKGLDGRKLYPRSEHSACNVLFQSAGAVIMKKALFIMDSKLQEAGLIPGNNYEFILNIHDEVQLEVDNNKEIIDTISMILPKAIEQAGLEFNFPCPFTGQVKVAKDWSGTH